MLMTLYTTIYHVVAYLPTTAVENISKLYSKSKRVINDQYHSHTDYMRAPLKSLSYIHSLCRQLCLSG